MKTVVINGQNHKGSTYHIGIELAEKIGGEITEFFLPRDFGEFCVGCTSCFLNGEDTCPHANKLKPITDAMDEADVIILTSPVYVYHATGAMKALLDHYGFRWMVHRPEEKMFKKQGVVISTAAGGGMKSTNKDMADSLHYWGIPKIYKIGMAVAAISWEKISPKKMEKIHKETDTLAKQIIANNGKVKPGLKTKGFFGICRLIQKSGYNPKDMEYWKEKGWLEKRRPWKER
ncbi:flavodoxin family protein [Pseudobutyrivibrio xylanivorans]|uniref:Flavodoxin family protein n=1 Tax=Pseudobutyrivibrio xylanivorans TaxID=185007 RepID=A0A5P6VRJ4_PSEXY|nr:flavodoxin family protein [Pseudobutyrivibrio xylanivorans]QFJ55070.1 flavodoxin family protein [Pseudobutyrivibrio xylanivorans]